MFDYNIEDAQRILNSFDYSNLRLEDYILDNWFERDVNFNYIYDCLSSKILLSISKTTENRFKLSYPHEKIKTKDFYIIIEIDDFEGIKVITAYSFSKDRREREIERK